MHAGEAAYTHRTSEIKRLIIKFIPLKKAS